MKHIIGFWLIALAIVFISFSPTADLSAHRSQLKAPTSTIALKKPSFLLKKKPDNRFNDIVLTIMQPDRGGQVRGCLLGMTKKQVQSLEVSAELFSQRDTQLIYNVILEQDTDHIDFADIIYTFNDEDELKSIVVEYYLKLETAASNVYNIHLESFNNRYGQFSGVDANGFALWNATGFRGKAFQVKLKDVSRPGDAGVKIEYSLQ
ncbi:MAG: hypothetical protein SFW35_06205 [Chitinophagales bacterium]|nr:hypothetical protein [Chitinophagales bacterium]